MINVTDLQWSKIEGDAPKMCCNMCGKTEAAKDWWNASIKMNEDSDFMVVICSDECLHNFKHHPAVNTYINDRLRAVQQTEERNNG